MNMPRVIEFSFSILVAFLVLSILSFLSLRPALQEVSSEITAGWQAYLRLVKDRSRALNGLSEAIRGFEPGHRKLLEKMLEARSITMRPGNAETVVAASDEINRCLQGVEELILSNPELRVYPPFAKSWDDVVARTRRVDLARLSYNTSVRLYNGLLSAFPQSLVAALLGYVPATAYPRTGPGAGG